MLLNCGAGEKKTLESPLEIKGTERRPSQLFLKETNPEYALEELILKLKLQFFFHPMQRADSL